MLLGGIGCQAKLKLEHVGLVQFAVPAKWQERGKQADPSAGYVERVDGQGSRVLIGWDMDPRSVPLTLDDARLATGLDDAQQGAAQEVAGHTAVALQSGAARALVWRCEKTKRLLRLQTDGPHAPALERLVPHVSCHGASSATNGEVPTAASAALGAEWRFGHRGRGSVAWMRDDSVLTLFAGQLQPSPRTPEAARKVAAGWVQAAGLSAVQVQDAQLAQGPQGHPGVKLHGTAQLDGQPVRFTLLFWRCLQRQRSFAAVVFARERAPAAAGAPAAHDVKDFTGSDSALLAARCHG